MRTLEICSHVFRYTSLMAYQISSLFTWPPQCKVLYTICATETDDSRTIPWFNEFAVSSRRPRNVTMRLWPMEHDRLMRRSIGRNEVCLATGADVLLLVDTDKLFGEGALDYIAENFPTDAEIVFPHFELKCSHGVGDSLIQAAIGPRVYGIDPSLFTIQARQSTAIGGCQIVSGDLARKAGYSQNSPRHMRPSSRWLRTKCDKTARKGWIVLHGARLRRLEIPRWYRIRHSKVGRNDIGCEN